MIKIIKAAQAAPFISCYSAKIAEGVRSTAPLPPVAQRQPNINIMPPEVAHTAQTMHRQNKLVCATFSLINSLFYLWAAHTHRQKSTYCMRAHMRTRARAVNRLLLLTYFFNYYKKCLCHCAVPMLARLCVCATRVCAYVLSVQKGIDYEFL